MSENYNPTPEQLSLYFDGLLPEQERRKVEDYLHANPTPNCMDMFQQFDDALQPELSDAELEQVLSNTVQEVHARVNQLSKRQETSWAFFLSPKFILASMVAVLLLMGTLSTVEWGGTPETEPGSMIAQGTDPADDDKPVDLDKPIDKQIDEAKQRMQGEALIAMAGVVKNTLSSGLDYAAKQTKESREPFDQANRTLVGSALSSIRSPQKTETQNQEKTLSTATIAELGKNQLAIGLGASVINLVTVF
jgi:hypothetical protein